MKELSARLLRLVETAETRLREVSEPQSARPVLPGGWSRREVIGHLVDSASNNHQRFVRAALQPSLDFPALRPGGQRAVAGLPEADWALLVSLWAAYNRHLAHVLARLPAEKLDTPCRIGSGQPVTLGFLAAGLSCPSGPSPQPNRGRGAGLGCCPQISSIAAPGEAPPQSRQNQACYEGTVRNKRRREQSCYCRTRSSSRLWSSC